VSDNNEEVNVVPQQGLEVRENVVGILKETSKLVSTNQEMSAGIYKINFNSTKPEINVNDIIVSDARGGYLRKVENIILTNNNSVVLETSQAKLEDVFKSGQLNFSSEELSAATTSNLEVSEIKVNSALKGISVENNGVDYSFSDVVLYDQNGLNFNISSGTMNFDPKLHFKSEFSALGGLEFVDFGAENGTLNVDCSLELSLSGSDSVEYSREILNFSRNVLMIVAGVPVTIEIKTSVEAKVVLGWEASTTISNGFVCDYNLTSKVRYEDGQWSDVFNLTSNLEPKPVEIGSRISLTQSFELIPKIDVKFYSIIGPYLSTNLSENFELNMEVISQHWDAELGVGVEFETGVDAELFGFSSNFGNISIPFNKTIWEAPYKIEKVSGDYQLGAQGEELVNPIVVKIVDSRGNALSNVKVYFDVIQGDGTISSETLITGQNGLAQVNWTLGDNEDPQKVEVAVKQASGSNIPSGTATFTAGVPLEMVGSWYVGTYTIDHHGDASNFYYNCGTQYGEVGDFYVFIGDTTKPGQIIIYHKSIIDGLPDMYQSSLASVKRYNDPNDTYYRSFGTNWQVSIGPTDNGRTRSFSFGIMKLLEDSSGLVQFFPSGGEASITIPDGTADPGCQISSSIGYGYKFLYSIQNINATYIGAEPPPDLNYADLDRFNILLSDPENRYIIIE
jgi:hypothetical protein